MRNTLWRVSRYLKYYLKSSTAHGIHSPFVYNLIVNTINNDHPYYVFKPLESLRFSLQNNNEKIFIQDYGAGSKYSNKKERKISSICKQSVKSKKYAQLLFRLVENQNPETIIELGTSLGLTTLYLSYACSSSKIISVEGSESLSQFAKTLFSKYKRKNIQLKTATFQDVVPSIVNENNVIDFIFIDGHHEENATINYFEQLLNKASEDALFVLDDIHWSKGMERAWEKIKSHKNVSLTIDLFEMGLVYIKPRIQKEHFIIRF